MFRLAFNLILFLKQLKFTIGLIVVASCWSISFVCLNACVGFKFEFEFNFVWVSFGIGIRIRI